MSTAPRILYSDESYRLATWQNVAITDVAGDIDAARMKRLGKAYRELIAEFPNGIVTCSIIREQTPVASAEARDEAAKFIKELGDSMLRMAMLIEHKGVMAQVLRTIIRGLNVVTRNTKLVMFNSLDDAFDALAPFVVPAHPGSNVRADLASAVSAVRKGYDPRSARQVAQR